MTALVTIVGAGLGHLILAHRDPRKRNGWLLQTLRHSEACPNIRIDTITRDYWRPFQSQHPSRP